MAHHDATTGEDVFEVWEDGGSNRVRGMQDLVTVRMGPNEEKPRVTVHVKK